MQHVIINPKVSDLIGLSLYQHDKKTLTNTLARFFSWCALQETNRLLWMALTFLGLIILTVPCMALPYLLLGVNNINLWILACVINVPVIAITLAAQPIKVVLPALFISWTADAIIILGCIIAFLVK